MDNKDNESQLQERYIQIELLNKQLEYVSSQLELVKVKIEELFSVRNAVEKMFKGEGFSKLGAGVFIKSEFKDTNTFLINVGRNIFVKMNKKDAENYLTIKIEDIKNIHLQLTNKADELQKEIQNQIIEVQKLQK